MNSRQRRKKRRAHGGKAPYRCIWCGKLLARIDGVCDCPPAYQEKERRRTVEELSWEEAETRAVRRGLPAKYTFRQPSELEQLAEVFRPLCSSERDPSYVG